MNKVNKMEKEKTTENVELYLETEQKSELGLIFCLFKRNKVF